MSYNKRFGIDSTYISLNRAKVALKCLKNFDGMRMRSLFSLNRAKVALKFSFSFSDAHFHMFV